ncbi:MAG: 5'-nucleotidase, lipoprotein e(P4) family [Pedobacter sp.]|nr:MAG: 5'-nucleotidase, lipoprotein e(P4) family [Pedobacter sp.]
MKNILLITFSLFFLSASAQKTRSAASDLTTAVLWQQHSGEFSALCFQAYNFARLSLKESLWASANNAKPKCVVVDVDETVLDNSAFQGHEIRKGVSYVPADWTVWANKVAADTIPGALNFLKFAATKNVEVFYVTNRNESELEGTLSNLKKFGFPNADLKHILVKTTSSDKEPRRQSILEKYNVLLLCGDNLSDFSNVFYREGKNTAEQVNALQAMFGTRFIVLPNPMYGDWEKLIYKGDNLSEEVKGAQRMERLKSY